MIRACYFAVIATTITACAPAKTTNQNTNMGQWKIDRRIDRISNSEQVSVITTFTKLNISSAPQTTTKVGALGISCKDVTIMFDWPVGAPNRTFIKVKADEKPENSSLFKVSGTLVAIENAENSPKNAVKYLLDANTLLINVVSTTSGVITADIPISGLREALMAANTPCLSDLLRP